MYKIICLLCLIDTLVSIVNGAAIQSIGKKTVIITGANSGVGLAATKILAESGRWNIIMACRSRQKAIIARETIKKGIENVEIQDLDLADTVSIRNFAKSCGRDVDVIACNAGVQESTSGFGGKEQGAQVLRTKQGYEITVGTNHIGHFLLLQLMLERLRKSNSGRVVIVGSGVHDPDSPGGNVGSKATLGSMIGLSNGFKEPISMVDGSDYDPDKAYKDSKLCNVMTSLELARRLQKSKSKVTCNVMNPGLIPTTGLFRSINPIFVIIFTFLTKYVFKVAVSEEEGGRCLAYMIDNAALNGVTGGYYSSVPGPAGKSFGPITPSVEARDEKKGKQLWELTEKLLR